VDFKSEWKKLSLIAGFFLVCFFLPVGATRFDNAITESLHLVKWYAREHVLLCLIPAFFIAGAISVFVSQASVMKYLGARANKILAYGVASVSGSILAVCSCTVLPLFAGIYKMGAGLGPATAFLYSGPAINVLAIILTARILGWELGIARAVGAIVFSIVIGLLMHLIYRKEEIDKNNAQMAMPEPQVSRPLWKNALYFASMVGILIFANWARSGDVRAVFLCCPGGLSMYKVEGTLLNTGTEEIKILDTKGQTISVSRDLLQEIKDVPKKNLYEKTQQMDFGLCFPGGIWRDAVHVVYKKRGLRVVWGFLGVRQADFAVTAFRCACSRFSFGQAGPGRHYPKRVDQSGGWW